MNGRDKELFYCFLKEAVKCSKFRCIQKTTRALCYTSLELHRVKITYVHDSTTMMKVVESKVVKARAGQSQRRRREDEGE